MILREDIAKAIAANDRESMPPWDEIQPRIQRQFLRAADAILALGSRDEQAIRADERERCAQYVEQRPGSIPDRQEIAAAIRESGGAV